MRVWRVTRRPYANLSGDGAAEYPGRWNAVGQKIVYTAEHPALAVLEVRVHLGLDLSEVPVDYVIMEIALGRSRVETRESAGDDAADKAFGSQWLEENRSPVLAVPSILVPRTFNYLLNPLHPQFSRIKLTGLTDFTFDPRIITGKRKAV